MFSILTPMDRPIPPPMIVMNAINSVVSGEFGQDLIIRATVNAIPMPMMNRLPPVGSVKLVVWATKIPGPIPSSTEYIPK